MADGCWRGESEGTSMDRDHEQPHGGAQEGLAGGAILRSEDVPMAAGEGGGRDTPHPGVCGLRRADEVPDTESQASSLSFGEMQELEGGAGILWEGGHTGRGTMVYGTPESASESDGSLTWEEFVSLAEERARAHREASGGGGEGDRPPTTDSLVPRARWEHWEDESVQTPPPISARSGVLLPRFGEEGGLSPRARQMEGRPRGLARGTPSRHPPRRRVRLFGAGVGQERHAFQRQVRDGYDSDESTVHLSASESLP